MRPFSKRVFGVIAVAVAMTAAVFGQAGAPAAASAAPAPPRSRVSGCAASGRRWRPGASRMSSSTRGTRASGTWPPRSAVCGRPSTAASPSRRSSTTRVPSHSAASHRSPRFQRRLGRLRGEHEPAERTLRRRHLQVDRRRQELEARRAWQTSEHIGKILIDPRNSNTVYVASQGPLWSAGRRAWALQDDRRRCHLDRGADDQPGHRRQ